MGFRINSLMVLALLVLNALPVSLESASAQITSKVYWTEWYSYNDAMSQIARADVDGSDVETVLDGFSDGVGCKDLVIDSDAGKLYFANRSAGLIERSNLDGSGRETVVEGINPIGLALDVTDAKIYWSDYTYNDPCIRRANLDGTDVQTLGGASTGCSLEGIALDLTARHVYFAERMTQHIKRCNMDGGGVVLILECWQGIGHPRGLALANGRMYWSSDENIFSATLSGDDVQPLVTDLLGDPYSLEYDTEAGRLYWVTGNSSGGMVQRINIDGTGLETLVEGLYWGYGLALELSDIVPVPDVPAAVVRLESHPNPFNPRTSINFDLPRDQIVRLQVHALDGTLLDTLVDGWRAAGPHSVQWDGPDRHGQVLPAGVYLCLLVSEQEQHTRKITLVR